MADKDGNDKRSNNGGNSSGPPTIGPPRLLSAKDLLRIETCRRLRRVRDVVRQDRETLANDGEKLMGVLKDCDDILDGVREAESGLMDARLFRDLSGLCLGHVERIPGGAEARRFNPCGEFAVRLAETMGVATDERGTMRGSTAQWIRHGQKTKVSFRRSPFFTYMRGALVNDEDEETTMTKTARRKRRRALIKPKSSEETRPTLVSQGKAGDEMRHELNMRTSVLRQFEDASRRSGRIGYFDFVLDPSSFGNTVRNMFCVSFLVMDRKVRLVDGERTASGLPELVSMRTTNSRRKDSVGDQAEGDDDDGVSGQIIVSITMDEWNEIVEALEIKKPMIKLQGEPSSSSRDGKRRK